MSLSLNRYRLPSVFGFGCVTLGHGVATRPLNGATITRPPFERFSNVLVSFPNEVGICGLADLYSNCPSYGLYRESIPFYGWKPHNYPYDRFRDMRGAGLVNLLSDLAFNGSEAYRKRDNASVPLSEHPVEHVNLDGYCSVKPSRLKSVAYAGTSDGFPAFPRFQTAPATLNITNMPLDNYTLVKASAVNYDGGQCYLRDGLERLRQKMASGFYNTPPASAGVSAMKFSETYDSLSWELSPLDPFAVSAVMYQYTCELTNSPLFDSELMVFEVEVRWEATPGPWVGTGSTSMAQDLLTLPRGKINQTYKTRLVNHVVTNRRPDTVIYKYGGVMPTFSEISIRPIHVTSGREGYTEGYDTVVNVLSNSTTVLGGATPGKRLMAFNSDVTVDLHNLQTLRFLAFGDAVGSGTDEITSNFIESLSEIGQVLKLIDWNAYMRTVQKIKNSGGNPADLLQVLSSTYLMVKYGIAPLISDANQLLTKLQPALDSVRQLSERTLTLYGSKSLDLPVGTYGYQTVRARASSKVVGRFNLNAQILAMYLADSIGLFPSLERIWDLVDYSFIADMFFNIDDRLGVFDQAFKTAAFVLEYHCSTLYVTAEIDEPILISNNLTPMSTDTPRLVHMTRILSKYAPRLGESVYDLTPGTQPDWFALGALIFQVLK
jgi:hypothetical protein